MKHTQLGDGPSDRLLHECDMPMSSARLDRIKELWRELQRTRPTSDRYQELVALIRAEPSAHLTPTDSAQGASNQSLTVRPSASLAKAVVNDANPLRAR